MAESEITLYPLIIMKMRNLLTVSLVVLFVLSSCIPPICSNVISRFKNCTNDTLFIGASHSDNIDSVIF